MNPLKLVADITANLAENINEIIATGTGMVKMFIAEDWEKAGTAYADMLILTIGKLPPRLTASGFKISATLDNLHELIPHPSRACTDKNGKKIPGCVSGKRNLAVLAEDFLI